MVSLPRADAPRARGDGTAGRSTQGRATIISAVDGFPLGATIYEPRRARATVVIHGAAAVPHRYYAAFGEHLAVTHGLRTITYDYRGIGASRPVTGLRRFDASMTMWAEQDARAIHAWARDRGDPLVMIGHSFGGQIIGLLDELREARVAVLVASQLGWYRDWPLRDQPKLALLWHVVAPILSRTMGYLPGAAGLGVDLPGGVAREWSRWCTSPRYLVDHRDDAADRFARWDRPTLVMSFADDDYAPPRAVAALTRRLGGAPLEHRAWRAGDRGLAAVGHFGFFRAKNAALWPDAIAFIDAALDGRDPRTDCLKLEDLEADLRNGRL
jgi:predicted alpha/beta hydrolase